MLFYMKNVHKKIDAPAKEQFFSKHSMYFIL